MIPPTNPAVTLTEVKNRLRLSATDTTHDTQLSDHILAATEQVEKDLDEGLISQTWLYTADAFPSCVSEVITLAKRPVVEVVTLQYLDADTGNYITVDSNEYALDVGRRQVYMKINQSWPVAPKQRESARVTFNVGYGPDSTDIPVLVRQAICLQVGKWFIDPAMEGSRVSDQHDAAYERIISKLLSPYYVEMD